VPPVFSLRVFPLHVFLLPEAARDDDSSRDPRHTLGDWTARNWTAHAAAYRHVPTNFAD
jgi:hypothetical protein